MPHWIHADGTAFCRKWEDRRSLQETANKGRTVSEHGGTISTCSHFPSFYLLLLKHGLQRVLTTHDPLSPPAELLMIHGFFQAQGNFLEANFPDTARWAGSLPGGEHRVIKVPGMKEALSRWSHTHIWLYFRGKKHLLFGIQVTKVILSEHCYSTQVFCCSPVWLNERTVHLESRYKCLNQNTYKDTFYSTLVANWIHFLKHRSQEVLNRVILSC